MNNVIGILDNGQPRLAKVIYENSQLVVTNSGAYNRQEMKYLHQSFFTGIPYYEIVTRDERKIDEVKP